MVGHAGRRWWRIGVVILVAVLSSVTSPASAQQVGSIRGVVYDKDFDAPIPFARVKILETGEEVEASDEGNYVFPRVAPGTYTLTFSKPGFALQSTPNVVVRAGQLADVDAWLTGDFTEMEEFVVQDFVVGGSEAALLQLRLESPALIDAISADLMSQAGASDAAGALKLVAGATVQDGKFAVIRGLPDRFVNSQLNGVRLPTADEDKRAVELDQFPSAIIDSIRISKTFTPDQQGDASGGAVNVMLKGIPKDNFVFQFKSELSYNTQTPARNDFLTYDGGGVDFFGNDRGGRDVPIDADGDGNLDFSGAAGTSRSAAPLDYKWSIGIGGSHEFDTGTRVGGFVTMFYERDSAFYDNGIDDKYWVRDPGTGMAPRAIQGTPEDGDFKTALFDVTQAKESVKWGTLATAGIENADHFIGITYLLTHSAEDKTTLAEDTRGKAYYFPGYDPDDPMGIGNAPSNRDAAPYIRTETLQYTERSTETIIFNGRHRLPTDDYGLDDFLTFGNPEFDWTVAQSSASLYQPDKRQFGEKWKAPSYNPGAPPFLPPSTDPAVHQQFKPAANFTLGNFQRIWKRIDEENDQIAVNFKLPLTQWSGDEGYLKAGVFNDDLTRNFDQDTFSNFADPISSYQAGWEEKWSTVFPNQGHVVKDGPPYVDVDYEGRQQIFAWYLMADVPLWTGFNVIGGARWESTDLSIVNTPEPDATWFPAGAISPVKLNPGDADVDFAQSDILPSIGFVFTPVEQVVIRAVYAETVARQTFKELTPIQQQEFLGSDVFIGNPDLQMSAVENFDLRVDFRPTQGSFFSASYFRKDVTDTIEVVQRVTGSFTFETPLNFPTGELRGFEFEARQDLGLLWEGLTGLSIGGNATLINSRVFLPDDVAEEFESPAILAPQRSRNMTGAPEHLYNLYATWESAPTGTEVSLFYTIKGDVLIAGAGVDAGNFVPNVYALEYDTLNLAISQKIGDHLKLTFKAKNLTNPLIEEVYRDPSIGADFTKASYTSGIDYSIGLSAHFTF